MTIVVQSGTLRSAGGTPTTVLDVSLTGSDPNWTDFTFVQRIAASSLGAATGTQVRLTIKFISLNAGATVSLYMAKYALATTVDFTTTPTHILFGGGNPTSVGGAQTFVSDWCNLPEAYDEAAIYLVAVNLSGSTVTMASATHTSDRNEYREVAGDAATVDKASGSYLNNAADTLNLVTKIEIR